MDLSIFLEPISTDDSLYDKTYNFNQLGKHIKPVDLAEIKFDEVDADIALVGVNEDRNSLGNQGCSNAPDAVRAHLLKLYNFNPQIKVIDLGNIKRGFHTDDTYFALTNVVSELIKKKIIPVIIGGSQDLTYANYKAYEVLNETINLVTVDSKIDVIAENDQISSSNYLSKIILHQPGFLFNYSNIGYQSYYTDPNILELIDKMFFDAYRLGNVRASMEDVEPIVRNADVVSFDVSAIRRSECPGNGNAGPNGFFADEACQIMRYAGLSDKLTSVGIYEINPNMDESGQTTELGAQMIWYFMEGFYNRKHDFPDLQSKDYTKFRVHLQDSKHELIFYKSNKSDRWWMDVPYPGEYLVKFERHHLVPCSYKDYQQACNEEMPDRWLQTYQKLL